MCDIKKTLLILKFYSYFCKKYNYMSCVCALYHIVINTRERRKTITPSEKHVLYKYITGIIARHKCRLVRINGIANHIHILVDLSASVALASLMAEIKRASSIWMKQSGKFPYFDGWGHEYYAVSLSPKLADKAIEYVKNQEEHHMQVSFEDEFRRFVSGNLSEWSDKMLT